MLNLVLSFTVGFLLGTIGCCFGLYLYVKIKQKRLIKQYDQIISDIRKNYTERPAPEEGKVRGLSIIKNLDKPDLLN